MAATKRMIMNALADPLPIKKLANKVNINAPITMKKLDFVDV